MNRKTANTDKIKQSIHALRYSHFISIVYDISDVKYYAIRKDGFIHWDVAIDCLGTLVNECQAVDLRASENDDNSGQFMGTFIANVINLAKVIDCNSAFKIVMGRKTTHVRGDVVTDDYLDDEIYLPIYDEVDKIWNLTQF